MKTKEQILDRNGFDFEAFRFENEYSADNILLAMEEYAQQQVKVALAMAEIDRLKRKEE